MKSSKGQSAIEFISVYSWSLIILVVTMTVIAAFVFTRGTTTYSPSYCYLGPSLPCQGLEISTNALGATATLIFINDLGTGLAFPSNSFSIISAVGIPAAKGLCYPANAVRGSIEICNATIPGFRPSVGAQLNPAFTITYQICQKACASQIYNTSGTATLFVAPHRNISAPVTLELQPAGGNIVVQGARYPGGSQIPLIANVHYSVYAIPQQSDEIFNAWIASGNVFVVNSISQSTYAYANNMGGTLTANFIT